MVLAKFPETTGNLETHDTSYENPDKWHLKSRRPKGMFAFQDYHAHLTETVPF